MTKEGNLITIACDNYGSQKSYTNILWASER